MATVVIKHVALDELPAAWRDRLPAAQNARFTVRIEVEADEHEKAALADNPLFGMWQDRDEAADVAVFAHQLRAPRYDSVPWQQAAQPLTPPPPPPTLR